MSNLLSQASLVMIPSGYKEDVVYSQIPTNGSGDLSFTRASNGTRINSAGLVEVCPWNLLSNTNTFSSWDLEGGTLTSGFTAPDGSSTAYKYVQVPGGGLYSGSATATSGVKTASVWLKSVSGTSITCIIGDGDASNTTVVSVTGDWQLFTATYTTSTSRPSVYIYGISNAQGIYVWHPQLNIGSTAKPYFPTTDRLNVPRLTYQNGGGGCPSLLLEKQSTNLLTYSEQLDNANWTKLGSTITANSTTSPDGTQNADSIIDNTTNTRHVIEQPITGDLSISRAMSLYAKQNSLRYLYMSVTNAGDSHCYSAIFDLQSGTVSATKVNGSATINASIESVGNGWYRCTITGTMTSGTATFYPLIGTSDRAGFTGTLVNNNAPSYAGSGQSLYIYGAQLEASSYPTSYIPTTSSSATRVADSCSKTGISSLIGQTSGAFMIDVDLKSRLNYTYFLINNTTSNYIGIGINVNSIVFEVVSAAVLQSSISLSNSATGRFKIAGAYANNDFVLYINGTQVGTDTSGSVPATNQVDLYYNATNTIQYNEVVLFPTRLTNAELASITSL